MAGKCELYINSEAQQYGLGSAVLLQAIRHISLSLARRPEQQYCNKLYQFTTTLRGWSDLTGLTISEVRTGLATLREAGLIIGKGTHFALSKKADMVNCNGQGNMQMAIDEIDENIAYQTAEYDAAELDRDIAWIEDAVEPDNNKCYYYVEDAVAYGIKCAVVLSMIRGYLRHNLKNKPAGSIKYDWLWTFGSTQHYADLLGLTPHIVTQAVNKLTKANIIYSYTGEARNRTHYTFVDLHELVKYMPMDEETPTGQGEVWLAGYLIRAQIDSFEMPQSVRDSVAVYKKQSKARTAAAHPAYQVRESA